MRSPATSDPHARASAVECSGHADNAAEHAGWAELLDGGKHADPECSTGEAGEAEENEVHPHLCRHARGVPEHDGDDAHAEVAEREELRRAPPLRGLSDDGGTEYSPDRHAPANDPDIDTAAVELSDDEHDEQDQEEALRDLAEGVDEEQRSQPALGEDRGAPARTPLATTSPVSLSVVIAVVLVLTNAVAIATARNVAASMTTTAPIPPRPTARPPSGAPMSRARLALVELAALATVNWSGVTTRGSKATDAGLLICVRIAWAPTTRYAGQIRVPVTASKGVRVIACATLVAISVRRRSQRSTRLPPTGPSRSAATNSTTNKIAVSVPDPLLMNT